MEVISAGGVGIGRSAVKRKETFNVLEYLAGERPMAWNLERMSTCIELI